MDKVNRVRLLPRGRELFGAALLCLAAQASAQSTVFVLFESASPLPGVAALSDQVSVPLRVIELGVVDRQLESISEAMSFVEALDEAEAISRSAEIDQAFDQVMDDVMPDLSLAYENSVLAGEISTRYEIQRLPAVIEIAPDGAYRMIEGPGSFDTAIAAIETQPYADAPPSLSGTNGQRSQSRSSNRAPVAREEPTRAQPRAGSLVPGAVTQYSMLTAILDANSPEAFGCVDLRISGVCVYAVGRAYCSPFGCSFEPSIEASIQLTHYNAEALVAAYKRLGASPLKEARMLFGDLQNAITEPAMELLSGEDLSDSYSDTSKWSAAVTDGEAETPSALKYHEVDVIGHPGMAWRFIKEGHVNPTSDYIESLQAGPTNLVDGIGENVTQVADSFRQGAAEVNNITRSLPELPPPQPAPSASMTGVLQRPSGDDLLAMAEAVFPNGLAAGAASLLGMSSEFALLMSAWNVATAGDRTAMTTELTNIVTEELGTDGFNPQDIIDMVQVIEEFKSGAGSAIQGLGGSGTDLYSMCPSGAQFMKPHLLSGPDFIQWKFNIPEMVFPKTYFPPLPTNGELYVGDVNFLDDDGVTVPNAWGSIYPRQGFVTQPDEMKAAAVAAARAAHVVTRESQFHVYTPIPVPRQRNLDIQGPGPFDPSSPSSGKWQVAAPQGDPACYQFGDEDIPFFPWTRNRQNLDKNYVFALWREYTCCPEPKRKGATFFTFKKVNTVPFDIQLLPP